MRSEPLGGNYRISFEKILFHIYLDDTFAANYSGAFPKSTKTKFGGDMFRWLDWSPSEILNKGECKFKKNLLHIYLNAHQA